MRCWDLPGNASGLPARRFPYHPVVLITTFLFSPPDIHIASKQIECSNLAARSAAMAVLVSVVIVVISLTGNFLYTGTADGWIKKMRLSGGDVEDWKYVGGRTLGIAVGNDGEVLVCEPSRGLLKVRESSFLGHQFMFHKLVAMI